MRQLCVGRICYICHNHSCLGRVTDITSTNTALTWFSILAFLESVATLRTFDKLLHFATGLRIETNRITRYYKPSDVQSTKHLKENKNLVKVDFVYEFKDGCLMVRIIFLRFSFRKANLAFCICFK